ncbi:hypothetical protein [Lacipirellula limnantheis]|nr:hypothetical protein [Lacipirellula limnantheis]
MLLDNMDDATPALKLLNPSAEVRLIGQSIEGGRNRFGAASERIVVAAAAGTSAQLAYDLPEAIVLSETRLAAWVSCNRPGAQLAATVILPRAIDDETGEPRRLLIRSNKNGGGGDWEQLDFSDIAKELRSQARVARAHFGGVMDEREAKVTQLVILAPGGAGHTEVWVDQVAMYGVLNVGGKAPGATPNGVVPASAVTPVENTGAATATTSPVAAVSGKPPAVPRIIQWQGEPLEFLQKLGFDAVWMGRPPVDAEIADARRLGMFIVCEPPTPEQMRTLPLDGRFAQVMAWDLGTLTQPGDLELCHRWSQAIEYYESAPSRPVLLRPTGMTREASRIADLVMIGRPTLGSTISWPAYGSWLVQQRRLVRGGTPLWVNVETHCGAHFASQLGALRGSSAAIVPATFHDLTMATAAAFSVSPRGFCFQSQASLAGGEPENQLRGLALELTNLRLGLAEPWLAGGKSATVAQSSRPDLSGLVVKVERSHLIIPLRWSDQALAPDRKPNSQPISFKLPGVPESSDAYLLSIAGSQRLPAKRVTGGLQLTVDHLPDDAFLLVTEDGYAYSHIERYLRQHAARATHARVELAALRRQQAAQALAALPGIDARAELAPVDAQMTAVVETMRRNDNAAAFACAAEAERLLDEALARVGALTAPTLPAGSAPLPLDWTTLAELRSLEAALPNGSAAQPLPGGDFEDLNVLLQSGWQRIEQSVAGVKTAVRLSPEAPGQGSYCLELQVQSEAPDGTPPALAASPVWVTSPPLQTPPGHLIEISGLVRVAEAPLGLADPLVIFDSIGGEEGAIRIESSPAWRPFRMVRVPTPGAEMRLTIALGGVGRAQVDGLAVRYIPLQGATVAQTPR